MFHSRSFPYVITRLFKVKNNDVSNCESSSTKHTHTKNALRKYEIIGHGSCDCNTILCGK